MPKIVSGNTNAPCITYPQRRRGSPISSPDLTQQIRASASWGINAAAEFSHAVREPAMRRSHAKGHALHRSCVGQWPDAWWAFDRTEDVRGASAPSRSGAKALGG